MSSSTGHADGEAFDAGIETTEGAPEASRAPRTPAQQQYLDDIADALERTVEHVEQAVKHLQDSLEDRRAEAERARTEADTGRTESGR